MLVLDRLTALNVAGILLIGGAIAITGISVFVGKSVGDSIKETLPWITLGLACLGINAGVQSRIAQSQK